MSTYLMYIDGQLVSSDTTKEVVNPATDEKAGELYVAGTDVAEQALQSAKKAEITWGKLPVSERISWMRKLNQAICDREEELRTCVLIESGKTWEGTQEDFQLLVDGLTYYADEVADYLEPEVRIDETHRHEIMKKPVGVCVAYLAWNFPLLNVGYKLGPAMATGCPIIIKPSIKTPLSAYLVGEICASIGLPAGAVQVLASSDRKVSDYISSSTIPAMLTLIGSTQTGINVIAAGATSIKHHSMELGGDAPYIVCADADLKLAADILTAIKYGNSGQICVSANRVFVEKSVEKEFMAEVLARTDKVKLGFGRDSGATMGPVIDRGARDYIHGLVQDAQKKGAELLRGGEFDPEAVGSFYPPTVLNNVTEDMDIYRQEVFGPVISMMTFNDVDEVIQRSNDTDAGLASYVFTSDVEKAALLARELEFGEVQVNGIKYAIDLPHTGIKQSGIGCDCSTHAMDDYAVIKRISTSLS